MTQEDKELLLKDICARLPYGVKLNIKGQDGPKLYNFDEDLYTIWVEGRFSINDRGEGDEDGICEIKPYLRPMSSMTEEEKHKLLEFGAVTCLENGEVVDVSCVGFERHTDIQDYLNACHLDYRGLIEKGLALEAPEGMYK